MAPPGAFRSCAISSLILQAKLVFNGWGDCGYMLDEAEEFNLKNVSGEIHRMVISAPPNHTDCTPNMMGEQDCITKFVRTTWRNSPNALARCLSKVRGVSQTCKAYKSCGPRLPDTHPSQQQAGTDWDEAQQPPSPGVCDTPYVGYFQEEEVLRMCGICDMFAAIMPPNFESPSAYFAYSIPTLYYGRAKPHATEDYSLIYFLVIPLATVGFAALLFVCLSSMPGSPFRPSAPDQ
mmetsp:Transcript_57770/g.151993  ORF Transcript_57770/g.151993 Transcript_57770/m.151993 type:complete len:235 (+) Transcript_57770:419-1123(+)